MSERDALDFVKCPECKGRGKRCLEDCRWCGGGGLVLLKTAIEWLIEEVGLIGATVALE